MPTDNSKNKENIVANLKGIKIHHINLVMILITCIAYGFLIIHTVRAYGDFRKLEDSTKNYISCQQAAEQVREASDYLTEQVRSFAATGNVSYVEAYFEEAEKTKRRDMALEKLMEADAEAVQEEELKEALRYSNTLMEIEYYSMRLAADAYKITQESLPEVIRTMSIRPEDSSLTPAEKEARAIRLVFNDVYREYKDKIYEHLDKLINTVLTLTENQMSTAEAKLSDSLMNQRLMIAILIATSIIMYVCITRLVVRPLQVYIRNIQNETTIEVIGAYEFKYLAMVYNNIYEINAENKEYLKYCSEHDKLTGVMNRAAFDGFCKIYSKRPIPLALIMIDIDRFKSVNDQYGHEIGDRVIQKVARLLQSTTRSIDKVIRYGGDEFIVIMSDMPSRYDHVIENKIKGVNKELQNPDDGLPPVSISAGVSFSESGYYDELFKQADEALYKVKNGGRCGCGFFGS